ncbi:kinesin-like protein KIN-10C isoform X2 [Nymphaea colorata]|uniref:kinesin-like protein KIN-10C isoform X2 n=1 Tax=Nymphaea colorata TaxID=210225 RepID=UPI00129EBC87|nr:kinesin-like protein KIN-10C isoform X2 [Nymphaea colorata]
MAAMADPSTSQEIPDSVSYPRKKIRIIAKIQELVGRETETSDGCLSSCISFEDPVEKSNAQSRIRLSDREAGKSETFKLDCCYGKDEAADSVFSKEISSLIAGIFQGFHSTILFYGGKTSGKNSVIQGLIPLSMGEILSTSGRMSYMVKLSCYEVRCEPHGDRCYDLLEPKDKEVSVWEDKGGRIQLKGLAQVPVQSISDFNEKFSNFMASCKTSQKGFLEAPRKCHRGMMVWIFQKREQESTLNFVGKMNFIDLAGYEGVKQKVENSSQKIESARINKSLCDLLRVVHGLNLSENGIAWRESKLARILRDSLGVKSQSLLLACLNQNSYQESVWTLSLVSRPCQSTIGYRKDTPRPKQNMATGLKKEVSIATPCRLQSPFTSVPKNRNAERSFLSCSTPCKLQAPCGSSKATNKSKFNSRKDVPNVASATTETRKQLLPLACTANPKEESVTSDVLPVLEEPTAQEGMHDVEIASTKEAVDIASGVELLSISDESNANKENTSFCIKFDETSPPISARLKALKENLEALCSPLPFGTATPFKDILIDDSSKAPLDPVTPKTSSDAFTNIGTPLDKFNAMSAGLKKSLIQEYLALLNTATKKELMKMKGIGEKRAEYILQLRLDSPEPLKELSDLTRIGLSHKQINYMLRKVAGGMFN